MPIKSNNYHPKQILWVKKARSTANPVLRNQMLQRRKF